jgi:hypothetical protein
LIGETFGDDKQDRQLARRALTACCAHASTRHSVDATGASLEAAPGCINADFLGCPARATGLGCGVHSPERLGAGRPLGGFRCRDRTQHRGVGRAARLRDFARTPEDNGAAAGRRAQRELLQRQGTVGRSLRAQLVGLAGPRDPSAYPGEHGAGTRSLLADLAVGAQGRLLSEVRFDLVHVWEMTAVAAIPCG